MAGLSLVTYALSKKYTDDKAIHISEEVVAEAVAQAKAYTDEVATEIEWKKEEVDVLPPIEEADSHTIYFVPASQTPQYDGYLEFITLEKDGVIQWEVIGRTVVDLSDYYTKEEVEQYVADHSYELPAATDDDLGGVMVDSNTINNNAGKISIKSVTNKDILDLF